MAQQTSTKPNLARRIAVDILMPLELGRTHRLHIEEQLSAAFKRYGPSAEEKRFCTYLTYGIVRHWFSLSHLIDQQSKLPLKKLDPKVRLLLRMGLFQLARMDSVPDFAATSTTLDLASSLGLATKSRGFINAMLQTYLRQGKPWPQELHTLVPPWWLERLHAQFDEATVQAIITAYQSIPNLSIRVNTLKTSAHHYLETLHREGIDATPSPNIPEVLQLTQGVGDPSLLPGYQEGHFVVQDESSAMVAHFTAPQPGHEILEIGAAPGTKTTHLAALMQNQGHITAIDISERRLRLLTENCERLGVSIVTPAVQDATSLHDFGKQFDRIVVDAPCSGSGTIGKHPEILLNLKDAAFTTYTQTQLALLNSAAQHIKPNGAIIYSTCSIDKAENQDVIETFLKSHPEFTLDEARHVLPSLNHDGFYMARLIKIG